MKPKRKKAEFVNKARKNHPEAQDADDNNAVKKSDARKGHGVFLAGQERLMPDGDVSYGSGLRGARYVEEGRGRGAQRYEDYDDDRIGGVFHRDI